MKKADYNNWFMFEYSHTALCSFQKSTDAATQGRKDKRIEQRKRSDAKRDVMAKINV